MSLQHASREELEAELHNTRQRFEEHKAQGLTLDMTRGKPSSEQLDLSSPLLTAVEGDTAVSAAGQDVRNYGGLDGLAELRSIFGELLAVDPENILAQGNSSLTLMHQALSFAMLFGAPESSQAWGQEPRKIICPVPGYDRHFALAEELGFELLSVPMDNEGPELTAVEDLVSDPAVKGIWLVPVYSNPTGITISKSRAQALLALETAAPDFRILWDNAYGVHAFKGDMPRNLPILRMAAEQGHPERVWVFASTSKITFAGAGVGFFAASDINIAWFKRHLSAASIGPDKINQLRHARFFSSAEGVRKHMRAHAEVLSPKFDAVTSLLEQHLGGTGIARWTTPEGGYFITLWVEPGTAQTVVDYAQQAGVTLTPAGATHPYGRDPENSVIRIAPSMPALSDISVATEILCVATRLAALEKYLAS